MRPARGFALLLLVVTGACSPDEVAPPFEGTAGEPVPMALYFGQPVTGLEVDGEPTGRAVIDTGAPLTVLSPLTLGEPRLTSADLAAFGLVFRNRQVAVAPVDTGELDCHAEVPAGYLGVDVLSELRLGLDYRGGAAGLYPRGGSVSPLSPESGDPVDVPVQLLGGGTYAVAGTEEAVEIPPTRLVARVEVEGVEVWALVDTGFSLHAIDPALVDKLGREDRPGFCCLNIHLASGGPTRLPIVRLANVTAGGLSAASQPAIEIQGPDTLAALSAETGVPIQLILGTPFFLHFEHLIDFGGPTGADPPRWTLRPYDSLSHLEPDAWVLPGFTFCRARAGGGALVLDVLQGFDASAQGVVKGDLLTAVGGTPVADLDTEQVSALIRQIPVGQSVELEFETPSGTVTRTVRVDNVLPELP